MVQTYPEWSAGTFAVDDKVQYNGVIYRALNARAATDTTVPQNDPTNWRVVAVLRIQDYNSLQEAIRIELNAQNNDTVNDSIPMFIQLAEESFQTRIRTPIQRSRVVLTTDADGKIDIPDDLLQVINVRINEDSSSTSPNITDAGRTEILAGDYEEYRNLIRYYNADYPGRTISYEAPVYWFDNRYFWIAPVLDVGTEIELWYYAAIPQLGRTVNLVNQNGQPINDAGQTVDQWVAAGNTANSFVQATDTVRRNWFTEAAPQMIFYGALLRASSFVKDQNKLEYYRQSFAEAEAETLQLIGRFEEGRHHTLQLDNWYIN